MHGRQCNLVQELPRHCRCSHEQRRIWRCLSSGKKGFGNKVARAPPPKAPTKSKPSLLQQYHQKNAPKPPPPALEVDQASQESGGPAPFMEPNQLLELFLGTQQDKRRVVAERYAKSLTSEFFVTADFLLKKAELQDDGMVIFAIKNTIRSAMDTISAELRPEIRFLNRLLLLDTLGSRIPVLQEEGTLDMIKMNDGYVFTLLDGMIRDCKAGIRGAITVDQQASEALYQQLLDTKQELKALLESSLL